MFSGEKKIVLMFSGEKKIVLMFSGEKKIVLIFSHFVQYYDHLGSRNTMETVCILLS